VRDIKARRKLHQLDDTLLLCVFNTGAVANLTLSVYMRVLLLKP
jgi:hypothetical protein